jgi:hypothetical protein
VGISIPFRDRRSIHYPQTVAVGKVGSGAGPESRDRTRSHNKHSALTLDAATGVRNRARFSLIMVHPDA